MLQPEELRNNHDRFMGLISSITREGNKDKLIDTLENSDFFYAPASTKYHHAYAGGLCKHSLEVYDNLKSIVNNVTNNRWSDDTIKIIALLHDISKINFYEIGTRNVKDEKGAWQKEQFYKHNDNNTYNVRGHEVNSMCLIQRFFGLTTEEQAAVCNHHGGLSEDSSSLEYANCCKIYPIVLYLHMADMMSCYDEERTNERNHTEAD